MCRPVVLVGAESDGDGSTMAQRAADRLRQAERDLALAEQSRQTGWHKEFAHAIVDFVRPHLARPRHG